MKHLKYTHPAANEYSTTRLYRLDNLLKELDIKMIKVLFTPVDFTWDDLENKPKQKSNKRIAKNVDEKTDKGIDA